MQSTGGSGSQASGIVAKRLRQAREQRGLSQRELGVRAGLDPSVASPRINQYEQDRHSPNVAVLNQLAAVLDQPLAYFFAIDDDLAELNTLFHRSQLRERGAIISAVRLALHRQ